MTAPANGYATVADYELRTGSDVPPDQEPTVQVWLDDTSTLIALYLGDCEPAVAAAYPDLLTSITCSHVYHMAGVPGSGGVVANPNVASASVGATSVTFTRSRDEADSYLSKTEQELLDRLMAMVCEPEEFDVPGVGQVGVKWGGDDESEDVQVAWVMAGRRGFPR